MKAGTIRWWEWAHRWSSLVCTLFLFVLCLTGLPLIFHDEIDALSGHPIPVGVASARGGEPLDKIVSKALSDYRTGGGRSGVPLFVGFSADDPQITVTVGPRADAAAAEMRLFSYDRSTGHALGEVRGDGIMTLLLKVHTDLLLGLPGMLFLGVMGLLFMVSLVSGVVLYAPFMRRLPFGTLRQGRSRRLGLLDEHNLLGIVTLGWALAIGLTGAINAFADPLTAAWRQRELASMVVGRAAEQPLDPAGYGSVDKAVAAAQAAQGGLTPQFIGFPGGAWSSPHHYAIFFQGDTPLTSHLLTPALVDADTGTLTDIRPMPLSMQALMLSRPLHFGDYGGLALKIVWGLLDLATIRVLWSGLVLWWGKRPRRAVGAPA
ncbi:PepSY-associated TM helix domain-containing protein [Novosphingobium cyanobacteriorum]|uniref:PepSY-associated TM helix domain-containing protein n=1 Tax=Novosphingobium cyanobacteriorum TaxID=3024215 RepID=A0ABT6CME5_9SPHN|nr:PepSY-associated TM helix domain-containing protein [Novosphingobium cyanobacteriorum]MDF8335095.1 PepSY-associated TM helix domain-containing protein [Novosphingobium cyanobacteriorum]